MAQGESKLVRVREGRMIGGVATGLARRLNIDVTLVRLALVAMAFAQGLGVLVYFVLWIIMPDEEMADGDSSDSLRANVDDISQQAQRAGQQIGESLRGGGQLRAIFGIGLIALGALVAARQLGLLFFIPDFGRVLWPLVLIVIGIAVLARRTRGE